jgi:sodium/proline symporter
MVAAAFALYLVLMLGIGLLAYRRTESLSDYLLGGRRLGPGVAALSAQASDMSGWLLLGLPGFAYAAGYSAGWIALGLLAGTYLNWRLMAARLRRYTYVAGDALTLPQFFEQRFRDRTHLLRILSAFFILLFFLFYTSSGLVAGGRLFNTVFGLPYEWAVVTGALVIVAYTFLGGFFAVSWTDVVQGLLMLFALVFVPVVVIGAQGGWGETAAAMAAANPALVHFFTAPDGTPLGALAIASLLGWGLGYFGQPHILARFMAIRSAEHIPTARRIAMVWVTLAMSGALLVGFAGIGHLEPALSGPDSERVFLLLVEAMFHPLVAGVLLAAVLAAIMSTADSQLLVASSALTQDFYQGLFRRRASQRELVWTGRFAVLVIAALALSLAMDPESQVLDLVAYAWAGFGAAFGPALLLSLFWRRMTRNGALAGILAGGTTVIVWRQLSGGVFELYEIIPGVAFSALAIVVVSLLDCPPAEQIQAEYDSLGSVTR